MTIHKTLSLNCTSCNKEFIFNDQSQFEDLEELKETINETEWKFQILVPNGSKWDFCPKCWEFHKKDITKNKIEKF